MIKSKKASLSSPVLDLCKEIAKNSNQPMSIDQIKAKYQLEFPFSVKKVANVDSRKDNIFEKQVKFSIGQVVTVNSFSDLSKEHYVVATEGENKAIRINTRCDLCIWVLI